MDKQQEDTSEWCSFEVSQVSFSKFDLSSEINDINSTYDLDDTLGKWNTNFDSFEVGGFNRGTEKIVEIADEEIDRTVDATYLCFCQSSTSELEDIEYDISERFARSPLCSHLQLNILDPVKWEETCFHRLKLNRISNSLSISQVCERWIWNLNQVNTRVYEDQFDYHTQTHTRKQYQHHTSTASPPHHLSTQRGVIPEKTNVKESSLLDLPFDSSSTSHLRTLCLSVVPNAQSMRKKTIELQGKTPSELRDLIDELESQATIYSEMLCKELDYRDRLKRDIEGANNFISSHAALQRKVDKQKDSRNKQKNRYGLFQQAKDTEIGAAGMLFTIPYIEREGGPRSADLQLITRILNAMEQDDHNVSKLISDYVLKLGDQHNLQTVIQVRARNGVVTSLNKPEGWPNAVDNL